MAQATAKLTKDQVALFEEKLFASVVTLFPDGTPQQTLVWIDTDGETVLFNTARGRIKERNLVNDPRVWSWSSIPPTRTTAAWWFGAAPS